MPARCIALFSKIAEKMSAPEDYTVDEKLKAISLTEQGLRRRKNCWASGYLHGKGN